MERLALGIAAVILTGLTALAYYSPETVDSLAGELQAQGSSAASFLSNPNSDGGGSEYTPPPAIPRPAREASEAKRSQSLSLDTSTTVIEESGDKTVTSIQGETSTTTTKASKKKSSTTTTAPKKKSTTTTTAPKKSTTTTKPKTSTTTTKPKSTTTTKPASPPPSIPNNAVYIAVGKSIQTIVNQHPAGTTFVIGKGVHKSQQVVPKSKDVFIGESGAVLDGQGATEHAFTANGGDDVVIRGLEIRNYATPLKKGTVKGGGSAFGWLVEDNEIHHNQGIGVSASAGWTVRGNNIHHNQQYGVRATSSGVVFEDNEIAFNNHDLSVNPYSNGGGSKFIGTVGLVLRNNNVHDNGGPGLWTDGDNIDTLFIGNTVKNNHHAGIKHEISCRATIKNNTVVGNGFGNPNWLAGAGIVVLNSPDVTITGNTVRGNADGIGGIQADRSSALDGKNCRRELKNLKVTGNTVGMTVGYTGIVTNSDSEVFSVWNNDFSGNTYEVDPQKDFFKWDGKTYTLTEWKSKGLG